MFWKLLFCALLIVGAEHYTVGPTYRDTMRGIGIMLGASAWLALESIIGSSSHAKDYVVTMVVLLCIGHYLKYAARNLILTGLGDFHLIAGRICGVAVLVKVATLNIS